MNLPAQRGLGDVQREANGGRCMHAVGIGGRGDDCGPARERGAEGVDDGY